MNNDMDQPQSIHQRIMGARAATGDGRTGFAPHNEENPSPARRNWLRPLSYALAGVILLGGGGFSLYQFPVFAESVAEVAGKPKTAAQPQQANPTAAPAQNASADQNPFVAHAAGAGVKACAATYAGLGKALTDGTQFMVQTQASKSDADRHALQGIVGMAYHSGKDYSGPAAGLVFAAPVASGCEGTMVRVVPFAQSCQAAASFLPKGSTPLQPLAGIAVYQLATGGQAMLMPSGQGCVALSIVRTGG